MYCINDGSNPTPIYVVKGGKAVLQCAFDSNTLNWYADGSLNIIASGGDVTDSSKYSVSTNPLGLYYRLHILKVGVSDVKKYKCETSINGVLQQFYLQLIFVGRCNYILVIFKVVKHRGFYACR